MQLLILTRPDKKSRWIILGNTVDWLIVVFALLGKGSALGGTYVCQIYTAELYPTVIR